MPTLIPHPTRIQSAGNKPKLIDEYVGRVNSQTSAASIAHMRSPAGWREPGQTPSFDEFTIVLQGTLRVEHKNGSLEVSAGQAIIAHAGEWIRYSTLTKAAPNTSPSACQPSPWKPFTGTSRSGCNVEMWGHLRSAVQRGEIPQLLPTTQTFTTQNIHSIELIPCPIAS